MEKASSLAARERHRCNCRCLKSSQRQGLRCVPPELGRRKLTARDRLQQSTLVVRVPVLLGYAWRCPWLELLVSRGRWQRPFSQTRLELLASQAEGNRQDEPACSTGSTCEGRPRSGRPQSTLPGSVSLPR